MLLSKMSWIRVPSYAPNKVHEIRINGHSQRVAVGRGGVSASLSLPPRVRSESSGDCQRVSYRCDGGQVERIDSSHRGVISEGAERLAARGRGIIATVFSVGLAFFVSVVLWWPRTGRHSAVLPSLSGNVLRPYRFRSRLFGNRGQIGVWIAIAFLD